MIHNLFNKQIDLKLPVLNTSVVLLQPVQACESGCLVRKSEFKSFDIAGSLSAFKSSDFSITSLEAVGALSKLKTTYMSSMSDMNIADRFETLNFEYNVPQS